jgi:hypothetical protein
MEEVTKAPNLFAMVKVKMKYNVISMQSTWKSGRMAPPILNLSTR